MNTPSEKEASLNQDLIQQVMDAIRANLDNTLPLISGKLHSFIQSHHHPLRSLLLLLSTRLHSKLNPQIFQIATAVEFLHTASILHRHIDDVESLRRQHKILRNMNIQENEASVLLGDYLLSLSFELLTRIGNLNIMETVSFATQSISRGQVLEIAEHGLLATPEHWYRVVEQKFTSLFSAAAKSGILWGESDKDAEDALWNYGRDLGKAVQMKADLKVLESNDLFEQKLRQEEVLFPLSYLLHSVLSTEARLELMEELKQPPLLKKTILHVQSLIKKHDIARYTRSQIELHLQQSQQHLAPLTQWDTSALKQLSVFSLI